MKRMLLLGTLVGLLGCSAENAGKKNSGGDKPGTVIVELDGLKSAAPAAWKEEPPSKEMRYKQFKLPAVEGDSADAELLIFKDIGGSADENVQRWKAQMEPPEGKSIDEVAKIEKFKVGDFDVTYLDVSGTFLYKPAPFMPKVERRPDQRMLAAAFDGKHNYHIKLTGPAKTVAHYKQGFDDWLKAFK